LGTGAVWAEEPLVIQIQVSPSTINMDQKGEWVTVHGVIPLSLVATESVTLNGVLVEYTKSDARGELVAKFLIGDVLDLDIISPPTATLTLSGTTTTGELFSGTDTVRVVNPPEKKR
jgi:hypothetical protein